jgi:ABC-type sugar transport system ATPase subunit
MAGVTLRGLEKRYGSTPVLARIDLEVADGEYLVLLGRSGCGKSTLLRCIAGLEDISAGDLFIDGRRCNDVSARERDVAMVFQSYALYPHMTVWQNMAFALEIKGLPRAEIDAAVMEAARMLELVPLLDRLPANLSGGQRQRVAMGRAVVRRPKVFLFDEPLSNLDTALRAHMRVELKRLHRRLGATMIHVTHDQIEALTLADRILLLDAGVVQQWGTPTEVFDRPANVFVARFLGTPQMNLVPAEGHGQTSRVDGVDVDLPIAESGRFQLGIRPGDLMIGPEGLPGTVDIVESLGDEGVLHVDVGPHRMMVKIKDPTQFTAGQPVGLTPLAVHRFDAETGLRR